MTRKKIDWEKAKKLYRQGKTVKEIALKIECTEGAVYNKKSQENWDLEENTAEHVERVLGAVSEREYEEIREYYRDTLKELREDFRKVQEQEENEEKNWKLTSLEKQIKILKEMKQLDFQVHNLLSYQEIETIEINRAKLQLEKDRFEADKKYRNPEQQTLPPFFARIEEQLLELDEEEDLHQNSIIDTVEENMFRQY